VAPWPSPATHPAAPKRHPGNAKAREFTDDGAALAQAAARAVVEAALAAGSADNVTAAVMAFDWDGGMT
jgi:hypothetical protein